MVTERGNKNRLAEYPVPAFEHQLWVIDQAINIGGVALDTALIKWSAGNQCPKNDRRN